ncbi:MAG: 7-cyano-7-deazaguanine synthase QueC [Bacteroidota bacterium]
MARDLAVVLASGGMDSLVTVAIAREECDLALLHLGYGQRTEHRERKAFHDIADFYKVAHRLVVPMKHLAMIGGSSLTDAALPVSPANLEADEIPSSYVPFRNANMLSVAVSWAEVLEASAVYIGAVEEDSSGYPDCREEFYTLFNALVQKGTRPATQITVRTPVIRLSKADIVRKGVRLGAPFQLTWSCYKQEDVACGVCDSCALRLRGFQLAGEEDPLPYAQKPPYTQT